MRRLATTLSGLGFFWAVGATGYLLRSAGGGVGSSVALGGAGGGLGPVTVPLLSPTGVWMVALLSSVTLLAGLPFGVALTYPSAHRTLTWGAGAVVLGFSMVAGFSVGLPYLPVGAVLITAGVVSPRRRRPWKSSELSIPVEGTDP